MKYTIELTEKQVQRVNDILLGLNESWGYPKETIKLEPIRTTNVEDTIEYQIGYKVGYEDGKADAIYNTDMIDELKQVEYIRGLEDAKTYIVKLYSYGMVEMENEFDETTIPDIIANNPMADIIATIDDYEEKKKAEIKVGDEVIVNHESIAVVTRVEDKDIRVFYSDGSGGRYEISKERLEKTGRNFSAEIKQLLDKLRGEDNE